MFSQGKIILWEKLLLLLYRYIVLSQPNLAWECIQIPHNPGPPCQIHQTKYEWPEQWNKSLSLQDRVVEWEVEKLDCKNQQLKLPNGEAMCWKERSHRDKLETALLKCSHIINWITGASEPKKTWYISELRMFIWDMCTCWGYHKYSCLNWHPRQCDLWKS